MPEELESCVRQVMDKGHSEASAWAICRTALRMSKDGDTKEMVTKKALEMADAPQTYDINGVEIFASGEWNGDVYTDKDLDVMVSAFNATKDKIKPYLKLGHNDEQDILAKDGLPAAGWVSNLYRKGKKLIADFVKIPKQVYELIKAGAYRKVSSEIFINASVGDQEFPKLLKGVALLGADIPAVQTLGDIMNLYFGVKGHTKKYVLEKEEQMTVEQEKELVDVKVQNENLKKENDQFKVKIPELEGSLNKVVASFKETETKMEEVVKENVSLKERLDKLNEEKRHSEINKEIDRLISDKKILPSQREDLFTILVNSYDTKKFKIGEKELTFSGLVLKFLDQGVNGLPTNEQSSHEKSNLDLSEKARLYREKHKVSYGDALIAVSDGKE